MALSVYSSNSGDSQRLAEQYRTNPPGEALQDIAEYLHDCMRDTGLFGGPEKTEHGESMAMRLYLSWLSVISKFLISIWTMTHSRRNRQSG